MGLLDDGTEYLRRSGRNLGGLFDWLAGGAQAGAEPTMALMRGDAADQPFLPTADSGGRIGAIASAVTNHAIPGTMPAGALGTYGGITAKTANKQQLGKAKAAINRGEDAETVRQKTGWFQDPTGDWKFEISDHAAELKQAPGGGYSLHHPELRRAYPEMMDNLKIGTIPAKTSLGTESNLLGTFNQRTNTAKLNERLLKPPMNKPPEEDPLGVLMHELQHGVQYREGFSPGTNPGSSHVTHLANTDYALERAAVDKAIDAVRQERNRWFEQPGNQTKSVEDFDNAHPDWDGRYREAIKAANSFPEVGEWMYRKYESALGEVEARDTQQRLKMTPEQRKLIRPYQVPYSGTDVYVQPQDIWDVREVDRWMNGQFDPESRVPPGLLSADSPEMRTKAQVFPDGVRVPVHSDVTKSEAAELLGKSYYGHMRGLVDPDSGQVHLWDAGAATHDQMAEQLGLDWNKVIESNGRLNIMNPGQLDHLDAFKPKPPKRGLLDAE